ncbi:dihydroxy-acid dehydratase [Nocardia sp. BMG51109]|uniref:dihydroxy-acid dehydratase domain-containing protein n=1 Tax=Nocardia sp. BMG51109 TaxID=1056816 RepID=UPI000466F7C0|nr:dihydroxy-acid dehydratase [Nocardia sp. BMG51109]
MITHPVVTEVTARIVDRSIASRRRYLDRIYADQSDGPARMSLPGSNLAHGVAAGTPDDEHALRGRAHPDIAVVSAYNDLLAVPPYRDLPGLLRDVVADSGGVAQFAGGVPALSDGVVRGQPGSELSLFSRDVIAMSTAIALSHNMFDGALLLGAGDEVVPGMVIGALAFGHLPVVVVPAGPGPAGPPRTGSDQLLMEVMGLHLPGTSFVPQDTPLRAAFTVAAGRRVVELTGPRGGTAPIGAIVDERSVVNGVAALLATGGATSHTLHLVAIAAAAGIDLRWDDFADLSAVVPTLARIHPDGDADAGAFHAAGGTAFLIGELLDAGVLHDDVITVAGHGLRRHYCRRPALDDAGAIRWKQRGSGSGDTTVLRSATDPFAADGSLRILSGPLGRAVVRLPATGRGHRVVRAPARVYDSPEDVLVDLRTGELDRDAVVVVRFQGPRAGGMPELSTLVPALDTLAERGYSVAVVTDGRLSAAPGTVPVAVHLTPEAAVDGPLSRIADGDLIELDTEAGRLDILIDPVTFHDRAPAVRTAPSLGSGRELFGCFRAAVGPADRGATVFGTGR